MSVAVPGRQIHHTHCILDTFHTSLSMPQLRFHPSKALCFSPLRRWVGSDSSPLRKPTSPPRPCAYRGGRDADSESPVLEPRHWIDGWKGSRGPNQPKKRQSLVDYRRRDADSSGDDEVGGSHGGGGSTMDRIVEKLKRFGYVDDGGDGDGGGSGTAGRPPEKGSVEDIFYVEEGVLPNARGGFSAGSPLGMDIGALGDGDGERVRFPWEKKQEEEGRHSIRSQRSKTSLAELTLPTSELGRLRNMAIRMKEKTKVGGAGVTQAIVDKVHEKWQSCEVVRLKCEGPPALNMKRMHEILERKTGGMVIWRSGTALALYRGVSYELSLDQFPSKRSGTVNNIPNKSRATLEMRKNVQDPHLQKPHKKFDPDVKDKQEPAPAPEVKYDTEIDKLLSTLGPRYTDWPGDGPLPVDADMLPGVVPGYKPPFRLLPYGVKSTPGNREMTALRRLARFLPPHFAVGRSRQHQGLAVAMGKLWESSSIAKIALKRGVQLTASERMALDIKKLTGGTILSRNKDFLVFYRGKDFLSPDVSEVLLERERLAKALQDEEDKARLRASSETVSNYETIDQPGTAGTLVETLEADTRWGKVEEDGDRDKMLRAAEVARHAALVRKLERKLYLAERKLMKAEKTLSKVEAFLKPTNQPADPESLTDEERFMFRKLGLKMKAFLLLGRRGVFDGTVENMHLHWKYRELVKIQVKAKDFLEVKDVALSLESESGGVLVSVDKISKGYAIIVFRGKDYQRPPMLRPKNLLTKRKALARSIELQRREALWKHISVLQKNVDQLKMELGKMEIVEDQGDEELYVKLDSTYLTEDEDTEDEDEAAYLEDYDSEISDGDDDMVSDLQSDTNFAYENVE